MNPNDLLDCMQTEVASRLHLNDPYIELIPTQGNNLSAKLSAGKVNYFVKCFTTDQFAQVDRYRQFRLQRQVSAVEWAPKPMLLTPLGETGFFLQVEEWLEGKQEVGASAEDFLLLGQVMASVHKCHVAVPTLDLVASWRRYLAWLPDDPEKQAFNQSISDLLPLARLPKERCLCHNDLHMSHMFKMQTGRLCLLDWEYAAKGSPYFDLATCLAINDCNEEQRAALIVGYASAQQLCSNVVETEVRNIAPVVALTNQLWFAAQQASEQMSAQLTAT